MKKENLTPGVEGEERVEVEGGGVEVEGGVEGGPTPEEILKNGHQQINDLVDGNIADEENAADGISEDKVYKKASQGINLYRQDLVKCIKEEADLYNLAIETLKNLDDQLIELRAQAKKEEGKKDGGKIIEVEAKIRETENNIKDLKDKIPHYQEIREIREEIIKTRETIKGFEKKQDEEGTLKNEAELRALETRLKTLRDKLGLGDLDVSEELESQELESQELEVAEGEEGLDEELEKGIAKVLEIIRIKGSIDEETLVMTTGLGVLELLSYIEKHEKFKEITLTPKELQDAINEALTKWIQEVENNSEGKSGKSILSGFRKMFAKRATKIAFVTLMLLLKFAPDASGADKQEMDKDKTDKMEMSSNLDGEGDLGGTTFQTEPGDFDQFDSGDGPDTNGIKAENINLERYSQLKLSNYYQTDLAEIPNESQKVIETQIGQFLSQINANNITDVLASEFKIHGSSDPRPTFNWGGDNESLTQARIQAAEKIIKNVVASYDFSDNGLSDEQIEQLKDKGFTADYPEGGVTNITDLINPDTGENYTADDLIGMSDEEIIELYKDCRYVNVDLMAKKIDKIDKIKSLEANLQVDKAMENLKPLGDWDLYDNVYYGVDNSGSMAAKASHESAAKIIAANNHLDNTDMTLVIYSNEAHEFQHLDNVNEISKKVNEMPKDGNSGERVLVAVKDILEKIDANSGSSKIVMSTDESFQRINLESLLEIQSQAEAKNAIIEFIYISPNVDDDSLGEAVSLNKLIEIYQSNAWEKYMPSANAAMSRLELAAHNSDLQVKAAQNAIDRALNAKNVTEDRLAELEGKLLRAKAVSDQSYKTLGEINKALADGDFKGLHAGIIASGAKNTGPTLNITPQGEGTIIYNNQK